VEDGSLAALVVLPTYDEAENITEVLDRVRRAVPAAHILVVDDGSPDGTADLAEKWGAENGGIDIMRRPGKSGLGSAYRAGFRWGIDRGFGVLVEMDSDFSHDPDELPNLIGAVEQGASLAIGSRYVRGGATPDWPWHRRQLSIWGNRYASGVLALPVRDATAGFRAYAATALEPIPLHLIRADGYGFQVEMAYVIHRTGGTIVERPISFVDRVRGTSKMSGAIVVEAFVLVTWWAFRDRIIRRGRAPRHPASPRDPRRRRR
jgi:dolichol-phosphate mannosyltransferase